MFRFLIQEAFASLMSNTRPMVFAKMLLFFALSITIFLKEKLRTDKKGKNISYLFALFDVFTFVEFFGLGTTIATIAGRTPLAFVVGFGATETITKNSFTVIFG